MDMYQIRTRNYMEQTKSVNIEIFLMNGIIEI